MALLAELRSLTALSLTFSWFTASALACKRAAEQLSGLAHLDFSMLGDENDDARPSPEALHFFPGALPNLSTIFFFHQHHRRAEQPMQHGVLAKLSLTAAGRGARLPARLSPARCGSSSPCCSS